jgi:hypothetical protein
MNLDVCSLRIGSDGRGFRDTDLATGEPSDLVNRPTVETRNGRHFHRGDDRRNNPDEWVDHPDTPEPGNRGPARIAPLDPRRVLEEGIDRVLGVNVASTKRSVTAEHNGSGPSGDDRRKPAPVAASS